MAYHVVVLLGTRPEAVKLAPLVIALRARRGLCCTLVSSGQHRDLVGPALEEFSLKPDLDLDIMQASQSLAGLSSRILKRVDQALVRLQPDWLLVQGDTTTAAVGGLCAFYRGIPVGHVEAGLRSHRFDAPFPEEFNRRLLSLMARLHFAPTAAAADNLHREGVEPERVRVTGNTGIDALLQRIRALRLRPEPLPAEIAAFLACYGRLVLVTSHRRENLGAGLRNICEAVAHLADRYQDVGFLYPLHPNPQIASTASQVIRCRPNVLLAPPLAYNSFIQVLDRAWLVLTDSGGLQEEAPSLAKPVLVMREVTERPEGVAAGCAELLGSCPRRIFDGVTRLLSDPEAYGRMAKVRNPYGDGRASERIVEMLSQQRHSGSARGRTAAATAAEGQGRLKGIRKSEAQSEAREGRH